MQQHVVGRVLAHHQVLGAIVPLVTVVVVNDSPRRQGAPHRRFCHEDMLIHVSPTVRPRVLRDVATDVVA